jgi:DNA-binding response OmpR family regulator
MTGALPDLHNSKVLVLEDDYYLATDLQKALEAAGAQVIGPFPDAESATRALAELRPDCALLDVNLGKGPSFELPRALTDAAVPFAFVTGYDRETIPAEFAHVVRLEKPLAPGKVVEAITHLLLGR